LVAGGDVLSYRISPDSAWVSYLADQDTDETVELYAVRIRFECNDGIDNDGDSLVDHPADPGCGSAIDASEALSCGLGPELLALALLLGGLRRRGGSHDRA
jgi:hypothetical protein